MAYEKNTWASGDVVTSAKLNNIENGIAGGGVLVCTMDVNGALNHTWQEIADSGFAVLHVDSGDGHGITYLWLITNSTHSVAFIRYNGETLGYDTYTASSADGYPVYVVPIQDGDGGR